MQRQIPLPWAGKMHAFITPIKMAHSGSENSPGASQVFKALDGEWLHVTPRYVNVLSRYQQRESRQMLRLRRPEMQILAHGVQGMEVEDASCVSYCRSLDSEWEFWNSPLLELQQLVFVLKDKCGWHFALTDTVDFWAKAEVWVFFAPIPVAGLLGEPISQP